MIIVAITITCLIIYFIYPLWLRSQSKEDLGEYQTNEIDNISIIYLSKNYAKGLSEKLLFLLDEIACYENSEIIVIDDASSDGTVDILQNLNHSKLRFFTKENPKGIPHSMNLGVKKSNYQNIIFCDQRQILEKGIIKKLISPLKFDKVGLVSSCISSYDKSNKFYFLRAHENHLKELEGKAGNLIGAYGPLFALKKAYYNNIPDYIILDDLYLTLSCLKYKKVVFQNECKIFDDNFDLLYSYKRAKRYLTGFFQLLKEENLINQLSKKQKTMLFWHKYFRIPIPLLISSCFVFLGIESLHHYTFFLLFSSFLIISIFLLLPINFILFRQLRSVLRFLGFYSLASIELFVRSMILHQNIYDK